MSDSLVLCYHAVSPSWTAPLSVTPEALERQLSWFVRHGWRGARFSDAVLDPPGRTVAVTFDDAFASVLKLGFPILSALSLPATVFAPTDFVTARAPLSWPGIEHWADTSDAHELESMSWSDLGTLAEAGWEIGSHTRTHPHLTRLDDESVREELQTSKSVMETHLGSPCTSVAYPYGDVDDRVAAVARTTGYLTGASLSRRLSPLGPLRWPRVGIYHRDDFSRFLLKASRPILLLRASRLWPRG